MQTRNAAPIMLDLVAIHSDFVASYHCFQTILLAETFCHVRAELQSHTSFAGTTSWCGLWIGPEHFHHQSLLAGLSLSMPIQLPDVVQCYLIIRKQATVEREELIANQGSERKGGEGLRKDLEEAIRILGLAFAFKPVNSIHVVSLVIATV